MVIVELKKLLREQHQAEIRPGFFLTSGKHEYLLIAVLFENWMLCPDNDNPPDFGNSGDEQNWRIVVHRGRVIATRLSERWSIFLPPLLECHNRLSAIFS